MAEIMIIVVLLGAIFVMWLRMCGLKKDIYTFSERMEQCLDQMTERIEITGNVVLEDSLWDKMYEKLRCLNGIWQRQNELNEEEKRQMKELISDISHQTKMPIANLKIYLEILEKEDADSKTRKEFLHKAGSQTEKLDFLLQSMVKMSRLETGIIEIHQRDGRILDTLGQAVAAIVPSAEKKCIRLYVKCTEEIMVSHDPKWTEEAMFNILDNAVKYTQEGGTIHITVRAQEFYTKVSIKDDGKGIAPERQAQIFGRFYREPEVHDEDGIGIGLYLARRIVTLQKGYIQVCSEPGNGADFQIYLPNE